MNHEKFSKIFTPDYFNSKVKYFSPKVLTQDIYETSLRSWLLLQPDSDEANKSLVDSIIVKYVLTNKGAKLRNLLDPSTFDTIFQLVNADIDKVKSAQPAQ